MRRTTTASKNEVLLQMKKGRGRKELIRRNSSKFFSDTSESSVFRLPYFSFLSFKQSTILAINQEPSPIPIIRTNGDPSLVYSDNNIISRIEITLSSEV